MRTTRVLLVEDDLALRSLLRLVLASGGYVVLEAGDGQEALEILQKEQLRGCAVHLIITDIRMPKMNGVALLQTLAQKGFNVPAMVISGHGDNDILIELLRLGCSDFLVKPFEPHEVLSKVGSVLDKVRRQQQQMHGESTRLLEATVQLDREVQAARCQLQSLDQEVQVAAAAYRELMDGCSLVKDLEVVLRSQTYRDLSGDFAGAACKDGICKFLVADVAGHDLVASYQTVLVKSFFDGFDRNDMDGAGCFVQLNKVLRESCSYERMMTAILLCLDLHSGQAQVWSAGHPSLIRLRAGTAHVDRIDCQGDVLGLHKSVSFEVVGFSFAEGDRFFLYTDGLSSAGHLDEETGQRVTLTAAGVRELVETTGHQPLKDQVDSIWSHVLDLCHGKITDDMLILGTEVPVS